MPITKENITIRYGEFEWNKDKNITNKAKHGISFEAAVEIFDRPVLEFLSEDISKYSELRIIAIGELENDRHIAVIYTNRLDRKRIISARRARKNEEKTYQNTFSKENQ